MIIDFVKLAKQYYKSYRVGTIPREDMPQLDAWERNRFLKEVNAYKAKEQSVDPKKLKPSQRGLDRKKVDKIDQDWDNARHKPILVSSDDYVIDGHHRWDAACRRNNVIHTLKLPHKARTCLGMMDSWKNKKEK
jgi:hypothetical protein